MKTIFRFFGTGALTAALVALTAVAGFGQDAPTGCADIDGHNALYTKFTGVYNTKVLADKKAALAVGKEYLEKFGGCEAFKDQVDFVKPHVSRLEKEIDRAAKFERYDNAVKAQNPDEIIPAGKDILAFQPDDINIVVPMALSATYKSSKENNYKYANDALQYSALALDKIKGGWAFTKKDAKDKTTPVVGVFDFTYTKENVIGELTFAKAYLTYYAKNDKKTALPLYYELSQSGPFKSDPRIYGTIGDYYVEQGTPIGDEIVKLIADQKAATDDAIKIDLDAKIKAKIAMFNGYAERALDAYTRAHNAAKAGPYKDNLYKVMQGLYKRRFEKETGLDTFISSTLAKPFPDPTSPVMPVADPEEPTTTTTTTTSAPAPAKPATTTTSNKPVSTIPATSNKRVSTTVPPKSTVAKKGIRN
jgi:tetratricopeptide (TPR) repeat protein